MLRRWRGRTEIVAIEALEPEQPIFGTFRVRSGSGSSYDVEIRSLDGLTNSCGCIDHRVNGLGTCKHIEGVTRRPAAAQREGGSRGCCCGQSARRDVSRPARCAAPDHRLAHSPRRTPASGAPMDRAVPRIRWSARRRSGSDRCVSRSLGQRPGEAASIDPGLASLRSMARSAAPSALARRGSVRVRGRGRGGQGEFRPRASSAAALPARGHAAPGLRRARAARRRDGPRQDRAGDRGLRVAGPTQGHQPRAGGLPGLAQGRVGGADRPLHRRGRRNRCSGRGRSASPPTASRSSSTSSTTSRCSPTPTTSTPFSRRTSSCSTRRSASRTGRPRRRGGSSRCARPTPSC